MDILTTLSEVFTILFDAHALLILVIGVTFGVIVGVLPGMGPLLGVVLAIPFTFYLEPLPSLSLLVGIFIGGNYGGAISSTLLGIPGTPQAAVTLLDGYPMALKGKSSEAISISLFASFTGTFISAVMLIIISPMLASFALKFGPAETAALALLGLTGIASLSEGSTSKGILAGLLGLILATIGNDPLISTERFTFGFVELQGGVSEVALMMGIFAVSELIIQLEAPKRATQSLGKVGIQLSGIATTLRHKFCLIRSSIIGVLVGVIPGVGGVTAGFMSYKVAKDLSKEPEGFGKGSDEGVVASESANSALGGGAMIPMMALGIPGDPTTAAMMGGMLIQGLNPGPRLFVTDSAIVNSIFGAFLMGAVILIPVGFFLGPIFVKLLKVRYATLLATVLILCSVGTYLVQSYTLDLWQLWIFGVLGYLMRKADIPLSPLAIGFVLGPVFEVNLRRTTMLAGDSYSEYLMGQPITLVILSLTVAAIVLPVLRSASKVKKTKAQKITVEQ